MADFNGEYSKPPKPHPDATWDDFGSCWEHPDDLLYRSVGKSLYMPLESLMFNFAKDVGYNKIGIAFGIYDTDGNLLLVEHKKKEKNGVGDHEWSIPSESVKGLYDDENKFIVGETIEQTLWRCITDELGASAAEAPDASLHPELGSRQRPLLWDLSTKQDGRPENQVFGYDVRLQANDDFADWLMSAGRPTDEAYRFEFFTPDEVEDIIRYRKTRNGFPAWYNLLGRFHGIFTPDTSRTVTLREPTIDEKFTWRGTRFAAYSGRIAVEDTEVIDLL